MLNTTNTAIAMITPRVVLLIAWLLLWGCDPLGRVLVVRLVPFGELAGGIVINLSCRPSSKVHGEMEKLEYS